MKNIILLTGVTLVLSSCSLGKLDRTPVSDPITLITTTIYPEFQNMSYPPKLVLDNPEWDVPRDMNAPMVVKRITKCIKVSKEERDDIFWSECGQYPPLKESNIYRGYSYDDFQLFLLNNAAIRGKLKSYKGRIDEVNLQRKEWRDKNAANREKLAIKKAEVKARKIKQ